MAEVDNKIPLAPLELMQCAPHRYRVTISHSQQTNIGDNGLRRFTELKDATGLSLAGLPITEEAIHFLSGLNNLRCLDLAGDQLPKHSISWIGQLHSLEELDLSATGIDDRALDELTGAQLRTLNLAGNPITKVGLASLARLPHLNSLDLSNTQMAVNDLSQSSLCAHLTDLSLDGLPLDNAHSDGAFTIPKMPHVNALRITRPFHDVSFADGISFQSICDLKALRQLRIDNGTVHVSAGDADQLVRIPDLKSLILRDIFLEPNAVLAFAKTPDLVELELRGGLTDHNVQQIGRLAKLKVLKLQIDPPELKPLDSSSDLPKPSSRSSSIFSVVGKCFSLQELELSSPRAVTLEELYQLKWLSNLRAMRLSEMQFSSEGLGELATLEHLKSLTLEGCSFNKKALAELGRLRQLETLKFQGCTCRDNAFGNLGRSDFAFVQELSQLTELECGSEIDPEVDPVADLANLKVLTGWTPTRAMSYRSRDKLKYLGLFSTDGNTDWKSPFPLAKVHRLIGVDGPYDVASEMKHLVLVKTRDIPVDFHGRVVIGKEVLHCYYGQELLGNRRIIGLPRGYLYELNSGENASCVTAADSFGPKSTNIEIGAYGKAGDFLNYVGPIYAKPVNGSSASSYRPPGYPYSASIRFPWSEEWLKPHYYEAETFANWFEQWMPAHFTPPVDELAQLASSDNQLIVDYALELLILMHQRKFEEVVAKLPPKIQPEAREKQARLKPYLNGDGN